MNPLKRILIEKAGYAHGWENVRESTPEREVMYSARRKAEAHVTPTATPNVWQATFPKGPPIAELARSLPKTSHCHLSLHHPLILSAVVRCAPDSEDVHMHL
jgi:hypothetical protein